MITSCRTAYLPTRHDENQGRQKSHNMDSRISCTQSASRCPEIVGRAEPVSPRRTQTERRQPTVRSGTVQSPTP